MSELYGASSSTELAERLENFECEMCLIGLDITQDAYYQIFKIAKGEKEKWLLLICPKCYDNCFVPKGQEWDEVPCFSPESINEMAGDP